MTGFEGGLFAFREAFVGAVIGTLASADALVFFGDFFVITRNME
jgi:hypothetical protein